MSPNSVSDSDTVLFTVVQTGDGIITGYLSNAVVSRLKQVEYGYRNLVQQRLRSAVRMVGALLDLEADVIEPIFDF